MAASLNGATISPISAQKNEGALIMSFVVIANSRRPSGGAFRAVKLTRKDAILTAVNLVGQGMNGVIIADEDGRVFGPTEFWQFFEKDKCAKTILPRSW